MHTDDFTALTAALRTLGGQRVWSLMISLFGDLVQDKGQTIDGPVLSAIMSGLKVRPEAARVALHRLRNDGWIVSQKSGRISQHALSAKGRAESAAASPLIYADPYHATGEWQLIVMAQDAPDQVQEMAALGFAAITPRVFVGSSDLNAPSEALTFAGKEVPGWLRAQSEPEALHQGYADLLGTLSALQQDLPDPASLLPVEIAVLRCLVVHNWRRLVLKHPLLPAPLVSDDWPGHLCQLAVCDLLSRYSRPLLDEIEQYNAAA